jgi:hypothetical protein
MTSKKMRRKRAISFLFLVFANIVMLAHVTIPHHYHEITGVCFSLHCKDSNKAHRHEPNDRQTHQHDGNPSSDKCEFEPICPPAFKNENGVYNLSGDLDCGYMLISNRYFVEVAVSILLQDFYVPHIHTNYISHSIGLRAPPALMS